MIKTNYCNQLLFLFYFKTTSDLGFSWSLSTQISIHQTKKLFAQQKVVSKLWFVPWFWKRVLLSQTFKYPTVKVTLVKKLSSPAILKILHNSYYKNIICECMRIISTACKRQKVLSLINSCKDVCVEDISQPLYDCVPQSPNPSVRTLGRASLRWSVVLLWSLCMLLIFCTINRTTFILLSPTQLSVKNPKALNV